MNNLPFLILFSFLLLTLSCKNTPDCFKSTGKITTELRTPALRFHKIQLRDRIDLFISIDTFYQIEVIAGKNLLPKIVTEVHDHTLFIWNANTCNVVRDTEKRIQVHITMPSLESIDHLGYGDIVCEDTLTVDSLNVHNEGNGDIHLKLNTRVFYGDSYAVGDLYLQGKTEYFYYHMNGTNYLRAKDLTVNNYAYLSHYGIADAYIRIRGGFEGEIKGSGNVHYYGIPFLPPNFALLGKGRLIQEPD